MMTDERTSLEPGQTRIPADTAAAQAEIAKLATPPRPT